MTSSIYPSLGLYWLADVDPTIGAGVPGPLNQLLFRTDTNQLYYKSGSADTDWTPFGMGTFAGSIVPTLPIPDVSNGFWYRDDLMNRTTSDYLAVATGTNGNPVGDAQHPGIITQNVSVVGDAALLGIGAATASPILFGGGRWEMEGHFRIPTLSNGVNNIVQRLGFNDSNNAADAVDGAYFEYDFATYGDHKFRLCAASNSVRTKVDTGILNVAGLETHWEVDVNPAGTLVTGVINGVPSANNVASNIPVAAGRLTTARVQSVKQLGVGLLSVVHDFYEVRCALTTPR